MDPYPPCFAPRRGAVALAALAVAAVPFYAAAQPPLPGAAWRQLASPAATGWSKSGLEAIRREAEAAGAALTASWCAAVRGRRGGR